MCDRMTCDVGFVQLLEDRGLEGPDASIFAEAWAGREKLQRGVWSSKNPFFMETLSLLIMSGLLTLPLSKGGHEMNLVGGHSFLCTVCAICCKCLC